MLTTTNKVGLEGNVTHLVLLCFVLFFVFCFFFFKRSFLYRPVFTFHPKWPIFASTPGIVQYRPVFWAVQFKSVSVPFYPSEQVNLAGMVLTSLYGTQTWYIFNWPPRAYTTRLNDNQKNQIYQYFISNHNSKKKKKLLKRLFEKGFERDWKIVCYLKTN